MPYYFESINQTIDKIIIFPLYLYSFEISLKDSTINHFSLNLTLSVVYCAKLIEWPSCYSLHTTYNNYITIMQLGVDVTQLHLHHALRCHTPVQNILMNTLKVTGCDQTTRCKKGYCCKQMGGGETSASLMGRPDV